MTLFKKPNADDWYDMIRGTLVGIGVYVGLFYLLMLKLNKPYYSIIFLVIFLAYVIYKYVQDHRYKIIETNLPIEINTQLITQTFHDINWQFHKTNKNFAVEDDIYKLKFIDAIVIPEANAIRYNFIYASNVRSGRPAFFFGIRRSLERKFTTRLKCNIENHFAALVFQERKA